MRFMAIVKPGKDYEAGKPPSPALMAAMGKLNEESVRAGIFVTGGGLLPSAHGHKLRMSAGKVTVTDGPFAEAKEVIGGFAILNYASREEAIEGARRVMQIHAEHGCTELEIELRAMMDPSECGAQVPQQQASAA